jgi:ACT domain-containing protein
MITRTLAIVSFVLNLVVIAALLLAFVAMRRVAGDVARQLDVIGSTSISTTVKINQVVPIKVNAPINQTINIPINQQLQINQTFAVEPDFPLVGKVRVDVPLNGVIPINLNVPVTISQTIPINAQVPVVADIPVNVSLAETPFKAQLDRMSNLLKVFAGEK